MMIEQGRYWKKQQRELAKNPADAAEMRRNDRGRVYEER